MQKRALPILFATLLLDMIGTGMVIPIIPVIFTDPTSSAFLLHGYSVSGQYFIAGLITALFGLMQFLFAPILGELSDLYGRKRLLLLGVGVLAVSQFFFGIGIEIGSVWLLLASRAVAGIAGANFSIAQASIADVSEPKDRAKNFGLIGAAFGIGFILGPVLSGWIANLTGNAAAPFWVATALGTINAISVYLFLPETRKHVLQDYKFHFLKGLQNIRAAFQDHDARPVYLTSFLYMSGFSFFISFIGILLVSKFKLSESGVGTFFGIVGVCMVVTQLFILRFLTSKYNERQILRYSILVVGAAIFLYPFAPTIGLLYFLIPILAIPQGLSFANIASLVSKSVSPEKQGAALGINSSLLALSQGVIPLLAGVISGGIGIASAFIIGAFLIFIAWFNLFVFMKRPQ